MGIQRQIAGMVAAVGLLTAWTGAAQAQSLGTFSWQLQPYCNRVTVQVTQNSGIYTLDGFDDQCGAPQRAPLVGLATPNGDGTIGLGFHIVTVPGGKTVSVEARLTPGPYSGPWTDSAGNSGTAVLGGNSGGSPRPAPAGGPAWGTSIVGPSGLTGEQQGLSVTVPAPAALASGGALVGTWGSDPPPVDNDDRAGVLGRSRSGVGVTGRSVESVGVYGESSSLAGVNGYSSTGAGVVGFSGSGTGVAASSYTGAALDLQGGPIVVSGGVARRPVFFHTTAAGNINAHVSTIDHPLLNGNANAVVFITHAFVPGATVLNPHPLAVWYDTGINRWRIFNEDAAAMPVGLRVAVLAFNAAP